MSFLNLAIKSNFMSNGCKRYYKYLVNLTKMSKFKNWKISDGKYKDHNFVIATDTYVSEKLNMGLTSIYRYKKTLQSLGLIDILTKFTTKTNQRRNYHNRQLTVVLKTVPRKLISKSLVFCSNIKNAKILKLSTAIVSYFSKKLNTTMLNIHAKIRNLLNTVENNRKSLNNNDFSNKENVQAVINLLNTYNINFKKYEIKYYIKMYETSKDKFIKTCKYCSDKYMYAPLKYFSKVFESHKPKDRFFNFKQREYDYDDLEKLLVNKFD
ncbi:hypothetical protein [Candidatus Arthromitus sp. SFB-turkey]|uniref:hypothetical protein n=1 Tax=Candidatus Arthromitus sp. SFB-turkey TaxID=1840217 RepID=UPI0007F4FC24|nr:hypothetical protein [Candidatus Arthromitus sp. SFB-turkey]OAT88865.1 hypothetical protein A6P36_05840 [Candidatus Arthromitus sp. SFB-turkey]